MRDPKHWMCDRETAQNYNAAAQKHRQQDVIVHGCVWEWEWGVTKIHPCPEIADLLSPHIAAFGDTGISILTGRQSSTVHPDNDLSVFNTVTFFTRTQGEETAVSLAGVLMNQRLPVGLALKLNISLLKVNYWLVRNREIITQWEKENTFGEGRTQKK